MIKKIKDKIKWAFTTKLGWASLAIIWSIVFGMIHNITDAVWAYNTASVGALFIAVFVGVLIIHAWVINPIRSLINKRKNKK